MWPVLNRKTSYIILCASFFTLFFPCLVEASDDFQVWSGYEMSKKIDPKIAVFYNPEFRLQDDASDFFYHAHRVGVRWDALENWRLGANWYLARAEQSTGGWETENRGEWEVTPHTKYGDWDLSFRSRTELRYMDDNDAQWRFRFKPQAMYDFRSSRISFKPYVSDEVIYDEEKDSWNQNRASFGAVFPMGKWRAADASVNIYYLCQSRRGSAGDWNVNHILGTKLELKF